MARATGAETRDRASQSRDRAGLPAGVPSVACKGNPPGKLADAELQFTSGPLEGLRLIGFAIWERRGGGARHVTFPARQYSVNGERRSFALLRPIADGGQQDRVRDLVIAAFEEYEQQRALKHAS